MIKLRTILMTLAALLAIGIPLFFALSALGAKFGLWDWRTGFGLVRGFGKHLLIAGAIVSAVSLLLAAIVKPRKGVALSLIALIIPLAGLGYGKSVSAKGKALPAIHDISTDTVDVPSFTAAIVDLRKDAKNHLDYATKVAPRTKKPLAETQAKAYPDIKTVKLDMPPNDTFTQALVRAEGLGWAIVNQDQNAGTIEATATTFWFGFKDDVVIRIRPAGAGSNVDVRSVSRVGTSDLGANAARIRKFMRGLKSG